MTIPIAELPELLRVRGGGGMMCGLAAGSQTSHLFRTGSGQVRRACRELTGARFRLWFGGLEPELGRFAGPISS